MPRRVGEEKHAPQGQEGGNKRWLGSFISNKLLGELTFGKQSWLANRPLDEETLGKLLQAKQRSYERSLDESTWYPLKDYNIIFSP